MPNIITNSYGKITISKESIAMIAGAAAVECYGIVGMASQKLQDGLFQLIGLETINRGIVVDVQKNKVSIDMYIVVSYGTRIAVVAQNVIDNVRYQVEQMTGLEIEKINVIVQGVKIID